MAKSHLIVSLVAVLSVFQPSAFTLDLTTLPHSTDEELAALSDTEQVATLPSAVPLRGGAQSIVISGISVDRSSYELGEIFDYQYNVRYLGAEPIVFPVSMQPHLFRPSMGDLRTARLSVVLDSAATGLATQATAVLYGSSSVAGSLLVLAGNQSVIVKGQGRWNIENRSFSMAAGGTAQVQPIVSASLDVGPNTSLQNKGLGSPVQLLRPGNR